MKAFIIFSSLLIVNAPMAMAKETVGQELKQEAAKIEKGIKKGALTADKDVKKALSGSKNVVNQEFCQSGEEQCEAPAATTPAPESKKAAKKSK